MKKSILISIILIVILAIAGYLLFIANREVNQDLSMSELGNQQQSEENKQESVNQNGKMYEVIYTDSGYSPSELKIKLGDTVTWKNESSSEMWIASAMHPTHTVYSGTSLQEHCPDPENNDFDQCRPNKPGESWSFTFQKTGTWNYHNHVGNHFGKIIVQ